MEIQGRCAFISGGAIRVGKQIALGLAERGCHIALGYHSSKIEAQRTLQEVQSLGVKAIAVQGNISSKSQVQKMAQTIQEKLGPVEILINNASIFRKTPWPTISEKDWNEHIDINLKGSFFCSQIFGAPMVQRKCGKIINLVDGSAERPFRGYLPYCVSKAALVGMTKALAKELAPHVQVNAIAPGPVLWSPAMDKKKISSIISSLPLKKMGSPKDIVHAVLFLVEGTDFATGSILYLEGGRLIA